MGCATGLVKYLIFFFNFLFVVGGIALITFGVLFYNGYHTYEAILPELGPYQFPPILMMVVGGVIFLIAFMGCCGTLRESKCMMILYAVFLLILLATQIAIAVLIYTNQDEVKKVFKDELIKSMDQYNYGDAKVKEVWDAMQSTLQCCGVENYQDWKGTVPKSCCKDPENCSENIFQALSNTVYFNEGCLDKMYNQLRTEYGMYAAGILALIETFGIVFGCCLGARFGRKLYHT